MSLRKTPGHLIRRLHQTSCQIFQTKMQEAGYDLTPVQFATLQSLHENTGVEQAQIAQDIGYDRATIGGVIDRLEQKGYVLRKVSPKDRRAREVSLSDKGAELMETASPIVENLQKEILTNLNNEESDQLISLMKKALGL